MQLRLRVTLVIAVVLGLSSFGLAGAVAPIVWEGVTWDQPYGASSLGGGGELEVTSSCGAENCWGAAHYNTPVAFRNAPGHSVSFTFYDPGSGGGGVQIWIEKEGSPHAAWTQFGAWDGDVNYGIYWWNVDTDVDGSVDTGVMRSTGLHTLTVGKRPDGTVDYFIDGALVETNTQMDMGYIGDVYLAAHSDAPNPTTAIFHAYSVANDYVGPPTKLCVSPYSGKIRMLRECTAGEMTVLLPESAPQTLCANYYTGIARLPFNASCTARERTVVAVGDQSIAACVNSYSGYVRLPLGPSLCRVNETEAHI